MAWGLIPEEEDYSLKGKYDEPSWLPTETIAPKAYAPPPPPPTQPPPVVPEKPYFATFEEEQKSGGKGPNYPVAEEAPQQKAPAPAAPPQQPTAASDITAKLAEARKRFANELDEPTTQLLMASTMAEVGDQPAHVHQAYIESVINRATAEGRSLRDVLLDQKYYPAATKNRLGRTFSGQTFEGLSKTIAGVLNGSNISNLATGNESGDVHSGGAPVVFNPRTGERFVRENWTKDWMGEPRAVSGPTAPGGVDAIYIGGPLDNTGHGGGRDPGQPMGPGIYVYPHAQRASPQEVAEARRPPEPGMDLDQYGNIRIEPGIPVQGYTPSPTPLTQPEVRFGEPVYGYTPSPTPVGGVARAAPFEPTAPTMITTPEGQQVADQWGFATFTQPGANQVPGLPSAPATAPAAPQQPAPVAPAQVAAPTQPAPGAQQVAPAQVAAPATWQDWTTQHLNMVNRGALSTGLLGTIQGLDGYLLANLPDWPILNPLKENLRNEQKQTGLLRNKIDNEAFPVSKEVQQKYSGQVAEILGQSAFQLGLNFLTGGESGWVRGAANAASAVGQLFTEQRDDAMSKGATEKQANEAATNYVHMAGPLEAVVDHYIGGKLFKAAAAGKLTVGEFAKQLLSGGVAEGMTEPAQQAIGNYLARTYDPNRPITEGMWEVAKVAALGGALTAGAAHVTGHVAGLVEEKSKEKKRAEAAKQLEEIQLPGTELTEEEKKAFQREEAPPTAPPSEAVPPTAPSAEVQPPTETTPTAAPSEEVKPSLAIPEEKPKVAIQTFDRESKTFTQTEMEASPDLVHQLKAEESIYERLIKCL